MAKYKLKALNVTICNKLFKKEDGFIFDEKFPHQVEVKAAFDAGYLELVAEKDVDKEPVAEVTKKKTKE